MVYKANEWIVFRVVSKQKVKQRELNLNFKYPLKMLESTLTKKKREKHENSEHLFEVGTSCYIMFTYCVPSSEDGRGQFLRFVFMSFCNTTVRD